MRKGRTIVGIALGVIVLIVVGVFVLRDRLDSVVRGVIEDQGSRLTGTSVTVGEVDLQVREGRGTIREVRVANPDGFTDRDAIVLGQLVLDIDPGSLLNPPYVIEDLDIRDVEVLYELNATGRRNLEVIRSNLNAAEPSSGGGGGPVGTPLLVLRRLHQSGGQIEVDPSTLGVETRRTQLPSFTLEDLGTPDGRPAADIGKEALRRLIEEAARVALNEALENQLDQILDEKLGEGVGEAAKERIGDLLGQ